MCAHCWRTISDWDCTGKKRGAGKDKKWNRRGNRNREEVWFSGVDRGLPIPRYDRLEAESESPYPSRQTRQPGHKSQHGTDPSVEASSKDQWNDSNATLPSWLELEEIERPASVAYVLDR
ncbi:hypothetical protein F4808DRAFT_428140 [Astrocystis sublimbata]|nr:hypothetical protein F4808DRAFT_428140 [Astrocystis sublimbata]